MLDSGVTYLFFIIPRVDLVKTEVLNLLLAHEIMLHSTLKVVDLEFLAPLRHELMLVKASIVADGVLLALVEMIKRERALVRCGNYSSIAACSVC